VFIRYYSLLYLCVFSASILHVDLNGLQISHLQNGMKIIAVEKDVVFVAQKHT